MIFSLLALLSGPASARGEREARGRPEIEIADLIIEAEPIRGCVFERWRFGFPPTSLIQVRRDLDEEMRRSLPALPAE